ncbi:hypothetical protein BCF33_0402 [Hasllibacter halocynthiae]|uniref:Uncharacterized protein n=1 Tax=Hasllibacter halocynthiae TaxID=595589 RepID=A0A2T0X779_9RHOB|nr:hypothetical protein [Hasllibacter halocynthiae]PRY94802.1 hypothetical protein BCF33_0402 [Hasllibacter halocynthiae]
MTKIATCCYCGTRAALRFDRGRHELVCASCGAPLHEMKALKKGHENAPRHDLIQPSAVRGTAWAAAAAGLAGAALEGKGRKKGKKGKRRKSFGKKLFEEAFDFVEDIFD